MGDNGIQTLENRRAAVRERLEELEAKRAARAAAAKEESELAELELELLEAELLERFECELGPHERAFQIVRSRSGPVVIKRPSRQHFQRFQDVGKTTNVECDRLVRPHVLHPSKEQWEEWLEEEPALLGRCADAAVTLAGVRKEEIRGK